MNIKLILALLAGTVFVAAGAMEKREKRFDFGFFGSGARNDFDAKIFIRRDSQGNKKIIVRSGEDVSVFDESKNWESPRKISLGEKVQEVPFFDKKGRLSLFTADSTTNESMIWDLEGKKEGTKLDFLLPESLRGVFVTKNNRFVVVGKSKIKVFNMNGTLIKNLPVQRGFISRSFLGKNAFVYLDTERYIHIFGKDFTKISRVRVPDSVGNTGIGTVKKLFVAENLIYIGSDTGTVSVFSMEGKHIKTFIAGKHGITGLFVRKGKIVISAGTEVKIWDMDGKLLHTLTRSDGESEFTVDISVDKKSGCIAVLYYDGGVQVFDVHSIFESEKEKEKVFKKKLFKTLVEGKPETSDVHFGFDDPFSN